MLRTLNSIHILHFLLKPILAATHSRQKTHFSQKTIISFILIFLLKTQRSTILAWLLHHSTSFWKPFGALFPSCNIIFQLCFIKNTPMADLVLSHSKGSWATLPYPFIIWSLKRQLFLPFGAKQRLHLNCSSNQVSFRPWLFAKPCYALCRSFLAGHYELWVDENGWVFMKLCWNECWCSNLFLFDASLIVWFIENGWYNVDVHCLLVLVICLWSISVTKNIFRFGKKMKIFTVALKP